jgi:hypothetical protein
VPVLELSPLRLSWLISEVWVLRAEGRDLRSRSKLLKGGFATDDSGAGWNMSYEEFINRVIVISLVYFND